MRICQISSCLLLALAIAQHARADIFILDDDRQVHGELVNRNQAPRTSYVVKTPGGGQVTLAADQVKEVKRQNAAEVQYDQIRARYPDTVEGQWKLAEWCKENKLLKQRKVHLERIIELDTNHAAARHGLGYSHIGGQWVTPEDLMTQKGYVRSKRAPGKWLLPQEAELLEQQHKATQAQTAWVGKLKRWHAWLNGDKAEMAAANIKAIDDPFAAKALTKYLDSNEPANIRLLYVDALGRLQGNAGLEALVNASLNDGDEEVRLAALDQVVLHKYKPAINKYVHTLKNKDNTMINRAGMCLGAMKEPATIGPLIDALVTVHTFKIQRGSPGQTGATFGTGANAGSFSFGGGSSVDIVKQQMENRAVLQALVDLTPGTSFNYDVKAWKTWYAAQKKPQSLDARRDGK